MSKRKASAPAAAPEPEQHAPGPGDRQDNETAPAHEAFRAYLEMGPSRSTAKVAQALGKSKTLIDRWSSRHRWAVRVREWENEATHAADDAHLEAVAKRSARQAELAQLHQEALALPSRELLRRLQSNPELLANMPIKDLVPLAATSARAHSRVVVTERLALGITTDQPGEPLPRSQAEEMARRLSDQELEQRLTGVDELAKARDRRARRATSG